MRTPRPVGQPHFGNRLAPWALAAALVVPPAWGATFAVTNSSDSGPGTFRQAINDANSGCTGSDFISFSPALTLVPGSTYPTITCGGLTITGLTTVIDGFAMSDPGCALTSFALPSVTVQGIEMRNFTALGAGIALCGHLRLFGNKIHANSFGVDAECFSEIGDGTVPGRNYIYNNAQRGLSICSDNVVDGNYIGTLDGTTPALNAVGLMVAGDNNSITNNVIAASAFAVDIVGSNLTFSNNLVGVNSAGTGALGTGTIGVIISSGTNIGVTNNVIGQQGAVGLAILDSSGVDVSNNRIGTNSAGSAALPNGLGVELSCLTNVQVAGNTISGNISTGMMLLGVEGIGSADIFNNRIGVNSGGAGAIPNGGHGIHFDATGCVPPPGAERARVGVLNDNFQLAVDSNIIANNAGDGIRLIVGNDIQITKNSIHSNGGKSINLDFAGGPLPNDALDVDGGPNNRQNYPIITSISQGGGNTTINFTLEGEASPGGITYHIELFSNPAPGSPAGRTYIADAFIFVPAAGGPTSGSFVYGALANHISATATHGDNRQTSEHSPIVSVVAAPAVTVSTSSVAFGNLPLGATATAPDITLTSTGGANYVIFVMRDGACTNLATICTGGEFMCSTNCVEGGAGYAPGAFCSISATFAPTTLGPKSENIAICDNAAGSPRFITLTGTGVAATSGLVVTPANLDFGSVAVGARSPGRVLSVFNEGANEATILSITATQGFVITDNQCPGTLPPLGRCPVTVVFAPGVVGPADGSLVVTAASGPPASAHLHGLGDQRGTLSLPETVDFGTHILGNAPVVRTVTLRNDGAAPVTIDSVNVTGPFTFASTCGNSLAPGASCAFTLGFSANARGEFSGSLVIVSNASGGSRSIPLVARAEPSPSPQLVLSPGFMGFGNRIIGTQGETQQVTLTNVGGAAVSLAGFSASSDFVLVGSSCPASLPPEGSCHADLALKPVGFGRRAGLFTVTSNAEGSPHTVTLGGTGCRPFAPAWSRTGAGDPCAP